MTLISHDQLLAGLTRAVARDGSQAAFCRRHGLSPAYLSDVLVGKRAPGAKILDSLGVERVAMYRRKEVENG